MSAANIRNVKMVLNLDKLTLKKRNNAELNAVLCIEIY